MEPRGIVTPEGVELDFEVAGFASRVLARLLDTILYLFVAVAAYLSVVGLLFDSETAAVVAGIVIGFVVLFAVPITIETVWRGRTVGKAAIGLRAVTSEGGPEGFRHAAIRNTLALVELYATAGVLAMTVMLFSERNQRLGDMAAGTIVVRERLIGARYALEAPAHDLAGHERAALHGLDVQGLGVDTLVLARQVLRRAPELGLDGRAQLTARVAAVVSAEIGRPRPEPVAAETFLSAVVQLAAASPGRHRPSRTGVVAPLRPAPAAAVADFEAPAASGGDASPVPGPQRGTTVVPAAADDGAAPPDRGGDAFVPPS